MIYDFIARHGRKYSLSVFAGISSLVVTFVGLWIAARVSVETARVIEELVKAYLFAAGVMVTGYAGSNAYIEATHARNRTAAPKAPPSPASMPPRESGTVPEVPDA